MISASPRQPLRVLHILPSLNYGGMERLLAEMIRKLDPSRFESHVLVLQGGGHFGHDLEEFASVEVASPMTRLSLLHPSSLAEDIRKIRATVVHTHSGVWYKASLAARMAGVPWLVHTDHGRGHPDPRIARVVDGMASRRTDVIVAVSDAVAALLREGIVRDRSRVEVIRNGVDTDEFHPCADDGSIRRELGLSPDSEIIGSIGRLEPIKGYAVMVEAFAELRRGWSEARTAPVLLIAGDGSERQKLEKRAADLGVADGLRWLGWRNDMHRLHSAFDLFTMSSHSEGTSMSLIEAMSAAVCPVVTDVGGNAAVLGSALRHRLVSSGDPHALAQAWRAALSDDTSRRRDALAAREQVRESFSLDRMVQQYASVYMRGAS